MIPIVTLALAIAAPVPKTGDTQKLETVYGKIANADSATKCELTNEGALRVTVPQSEKLYVLDANKIPPPIIVKQVEGEFKVTIRVSHSPPKAAGNAKGNLTSVIAVSAGVSIIGVGDPQDNVVFVHRHQKDGKWETGVDHFTNYSKGSNGFSTHGSAFNDKPIWLRLTRLQNSITSETSPDGKTWSLQRKHPLDRLGSKVTISPVAFQSTDSDYTATFDNYEIKQMKAEDKK